MRRRGGPFSSIRATKNKMQSRPHTAHATHFSFPLKKYERPKSKTALLLRKLAAMNEKRKGKKLTRKKIKESSGGG